MLYQCSTQPTRGDNILLVVETCLNTDVAGFKTNCSSDQLGGENACCFEVAESLGPELGCGVVRNYRQA